MKLDGTYWNNRYVEKATSWDTGEITTPLKEYIDQLTEKKISILIPGCGNSYEADYLIQKGFTNITIVDISQVLCNRLREKFRPYLSAGLTILCTDFFDHQGEYDLIIEQTFFCALDPSLRNDYVDAMHRLLRPGGKLVGLLFDRVFEGGPPFGGTEIEYRQLFQQKFTISIMEKSYNSIEPRKDSELFIKLIK